MLFVTAHEHLPFLLHGSCLYDYLRGNFEIQVGAETVLFNVGAWYLCSAESVKICLCLLDSPQISVNVNGRMV